MKSEKAVSTKKVEKLYSYDGFGAYTYKISENTRMQIATAIQLAIARLKEKNPKNPNIEIYEKLLRRFEYQ